MLRLTPQELTLDAAPASATLPRRTLAGVALQYGVEAVVSDGQKVRFEAGSLPLEGKKPKMYMYHDATQPIGLVTAREVVGDTVLFEARISETRQGDEALQLAKDGVLDSVSVGILPVEFSFDEAGTMIVTKADWQELSLLPYGAFEAAKVERVAASIHQNEDEVVLNSKQDPEQEVEKMETETPQAVEAAAVHTVYAQPRKLRLPSTSEYIASYVRGGADFAQMNANIKQAVVEAAPGVAPYINTESTPGILPEIITGSVYDGLNPVRPFVTAIGTRAMPTQGATFRRPKITTRPVVQQQSAQFDTLNASTVVVSNNDISKLSFGTYVTVSEQDLDFSDPASIDIILNQLAPFVGAPNLMGQNAAGNSSATSWNGNPLGLVLVVDRHAPGSFMGHAAGPAAGFEFYEQQKGAISVEVPATMGRTIAFRGYAAGFMADATKFVKFV